MGMQPHKGMEVGDAGIGRRQPFGSAGAEPNRGPNERSGRAPGSAQYIAR